MKRTAFLLMSGCICSAIFAQTDTIALTPVEVKAIRAAATAPFTKTNLKKEDIVTQNLGQDLPFLLNQTPSVVVSSDAGTGVGYTGIRIRGTDATRINVTLNGVPFNDAESNGTFFVNLPDFLSSVNTIQVQRGVGTSSNGPGAFGATINLSTNEVIKQRALEINNSYGSFNTQKNTILFNSGLFGNYFLADARISRIASDGYIDRATSDLKAYYLSTAFLKQKTSLRFTTFSGKERTYQAWYGVPEEQLKTNRTFNSAGTERPGEPYENEVDNYRQTHYQLFFNQQLAHGLNLNTGLFLVRGKGFYEQYKANRRYSSFGQTPPPGFTRTDLIRQLWLDNYYYGNIFSLQYENGHSSGTLGGAITRYTGEHFGKLVWAQHGLTDPDNKWYDTPAEKNDANVYLKWQEKLNPNWQLYGDLQWRGVAYEINGFRDNPALQIDNRYHFFNPKFGISYLKKGWNIYHSYGIANKEPNRDDFEAGNTEQPRPERLYNMETGIEKKGSNYNWGINLYYMLYKDQLVLTGKINDVGAYTRTNIEDSYRAGIELQGSAKPYKWMQASGNIAFSRNRVRNFSEYIDDYDNGGQKQNHYKEADIAYSPELVGSATLSFLPFKNASLSLIGKYVSDQYLDNTQQESRKLDAFFTQDLRAVYSFKRKGLKEVM
ncbi:MAG TPA: TonB-dependent receptor plug domain-containing protein, partial [Flavisolibacter sp.]|nr:TonB-dependent receptor plug domain-containing protein [Flavisolibacter sp.]